MSTTRLAPRTVVKFGFAASLPSHLVATNGYRTLCGETLPTTLCAGVAITCRGCCTVAAHKR